VENPTRARTRGFLTIEMRNRYTVLLIFTLVLMSVVPFIAGDELAIFSMKLMLSAILLVGIYTGRRMSRVLVLGVALGIPVLVGRWLPQYSRGTVFYCSSDGAAGKSRNRSLDQPDQRIASRISGWRDATLPRPRCSDPKRDPMSRGCSTV
jgi:hypothetical protein